MYEIVQARELEKRAGIEQELCQLVEYHLKICAMAAKAARTQHYSAALFMLRELGDTDRQIADLCKMIEGWECSSIQDRTWSYQEQSQ